MSSALKARQDSDRLRPWGPRSQKAEVSESSEDEAGSELGSGDQKAEKRGRLNPGKLVAKRWSLDQSPVGP